MISRHIIAASLLAVAVYADVLTNGVFRFLTVTLPDGTTNAGYAARFVTANADGPVTFSALSALPSGLTLDSQSGYLTGIPTATFNGNITIAANDGTQQIQTNVHLKINASGGGGNSGASFASITLTGRVSNLYSNQLTIVSGVGPFTFGAKDLPPGISLNGQTGILAGNPTTAGRYYVTFSAYDAGEANNSATVLPFLVLPADSDFQFVTQSLNNGEVGTPFDDAYLVTNAAGTVTFSAKGLPAGLALDPDTGLVAGTPTEAGSYIVTIVANDGQHTIASNLGMIIAPTSASHFYWNAFNLPTGFLGISYDRQPPITVAAVNGVTVTYNATGLPPGIVYNATTGQLSGAPTGIGEFNTIFTATDSTTGDVLTFIGLNFVILPTTGGDINSIPLNVWFAKQKLKLGVDGNETWSGQLIFNADRRTGSRFDPALDDLSLAISTRTFDFPAGTLQGTAAAYSYKSPTDTNPVQSVSLSLVKQSLKWTASRDAFAITLPSTETVEFSLAGQTQRSDVRFNTAGAATAFTVVRPAFVLSSGKLTAGNPSNDTATLTLLLNDASFLYQTGDTLKIRLLEGATVLADRDFTALGVGTTTTGSVGQLVFAIKTSKDTETVNAIKKFSYSTTKGRASLALAGLTLGALSNSEAHLTIELTIGNRVYTTGVTVFGSNPGSYSTTMPVN